MNKLLSLLLIFSMILTSCASCEEEAVKPPPPPAVIEDKSECVPLEERQDCFIMGDELKALYLDSAADLQGACKSKCKMVPSVVFSGAVIDLSILDFLEFKEELVRIDIRANTRMESLNGVNQYSEIALMDIEKNTALRTLEGLESVRFMYGIRIEENTVLESLKGLDSVEAFGTLEKPGNGLRLYENPKLTSLDGLQSLRETTRLYVNRNESLESLKGLAALKDVHDSVTITDNARLKDLPVGAVRRIRKNIRIEGNPKLAPCQIEAFLSEVEEMPPQVRIVGNGVDSPELCP